MDEKYIMKFIEETRNFKKGLEAAENSILNYSEANFAAAYDSSEKINEWKNMSYQDFLKSEESMARGLTMSEEEFEKYKQEQIQSLEANVSLSQNSRGKYTLENDERVEELIDEKTEEIKANVARKKKVINNYIKLMTAQAEVLKDELDDIYKAMIKAENKEEKIRLNVEFNTLKQSLDNIQKALESMKNFASIIEKIEAAYKKDNISYDASVKYAEELSNISQDCDELENQVNGVDFNKFVVDVTFDPTTNMYKVHCQCGNVTLAPAKEFTKEQLTSEAIQGVLYKFADKVAANSPLTAKEIREKSVSCIANGKDLGSFSFDDVSEKIVGDLQEEKKETVENPEKQEEPEKVEGASDEVKPEENQDNINEPSEEETEKKNENEEPKEDKEQTEEKEETKGEVEVVEELENPENENASKVDPSLKDVMKGAKKVISIRKTSFHNLEKASGIIAVSAVGLGLALGAPALTMVGVGAAAAAGAVSVVDIANNAYDYIRYNSVIHKLNKVARKMTKNYNKGNKESGIKFKVKGNASTGELRYAIYKDGKEVGVVDGHTTGTLMDAGLNDDEATKVVDAFNTLLNKEFKAINDDEKRRDSYYEKFGVPKIDVDNLEAAFTEFGGYNFGYEANEFGEMDVKKVSSSGRGIKSLFRKAKELRGSTTTEEMLDELAERNVQAMGDGTTTGADVSEEEIEAELGNAPENEDYSDAIDVAEIERMLNEENSPEVERVPEEDVEVLDQDMNVVTPETTPELPKEEPLNSQENVQDAVVLNNFVANPIIAALEDVERDQFMSDFMNLDPEKKNSVMANLENGTITDIDDLRAAMTNQDIAQSNILQ